MGFVKHPITPQASVIGAPAEVKGEKTLELTHVLSHQKLHAQFVIKNVSELPDIPDTLVVSLSDLDNYAFSRLTLRAIEFLAQR